MADAIEDTVLGTHVFTLQQDLSNPEAVLAVATCDLVFGCVDSVYARFLLNKIASTYCVPYIDVGIGTRANGRGGIDHATGAVHYLQPDRSSLVNRGVFSMEDVRADAMARSAPDEYANQLNDGYIRGADVSRPAVITINQLFASYCWWQINEGTINHRRRTDQMPIRRRGPNHSVPQDADELCRQPKRRTHTPGNMDNLCRTLQLLER